MRRIFLVVGVLLVSFFVFNGTMAEMEESQSLNEKKSYIVELDDEPIFHHVTPDQEGYSLAANDLQQEINEGQGQVLHSIESKGISFNKKHEFMLAFNGFVLEIDEEQAKDVAEIPGIKAVHEDKEFSVELSDSVPLIGAPEVWDEVDPDGDQLTGEEMNVAVIDTGIDYDHPDLGEGFGDNYKVVDGYNFVDNNDDPMDTHGHGTHVAGIVAGNGEIKGVSPDASLLAYKVIDDDGRGQISDILAAFEASTDPTNSNRADVINVSLGLEDEEGKLISEAAEYAVKSGVVVVASAGNEGPDYGTITHPGGAEGVLTVGASTSGVKVPKMEMVSPSSQDLEIYRLGFSANPQDDSFQSELVDVGQGNPEDYKEKNVEGKIVLIQSTSESDFLDKAQVADEMGARGSIFFLSYGSPLSEQYDGFFNFNDEDRRLSNDLQHEFSDVNSDDYGRLSDLIAVEVSEQTALELKENLADNDVTIQVSSEDITDDIPAFSSKGEADNFQLAPNFVAPGVEIASTLPRSQSNYGRSSGTSMSTPHAAGAAALIKQLHPDWEPEDISSALIGTADQLDSYDPLAQGTGRLDLQEAIQTDITTVENAVSFGLADLSDEKIQETEQFTVKNHGDEQVELDLTIQQFDDDSSVSVDPSNLIIDPGETANVDITVEAERSENYEDIMGWIQMENHHDESSFQLPYYVADRPLLLYASPDPAYGMTDVFIYSPVNDIDAPNVSVEDPDGQTEVYTAEHDHDHWWRASIDVDQSGDYKVSAQTSIQSDGIVLNGTTLFQGEVYEESVTGSEQWESIGPNATGAKLTMDPDEDNTIYATNGTGFFVTNNLAKDWSEMRNLPIAGGSIKKHIIDPNDSDRWYVAINGGSNDATYNGRVLMSDDAGMSWTITPFPDEEINALWLAGNGTLVAISDDNKISYSYDQGNNWEIIDGVWDQYYDSDLIGNSLLIGTRKGLYRIDLTQDPMKQDLLFESPSLSPQIQRVAGDDSVLLASTFSDGLFASFDDGETWEQINEEIKGLVLYVDVIDGIIYASKAKDFWVGENYGETWDEWDSPIQSPITHVAHLNTDQGETKYISVNGGIFSTSDGQSFDRVGLPGALIYDLEFSEDELITGTEFGTYKQSNPYDDEIDQEWGLSGKEGSMGVAITHVEALSSDPNTLYRARLGGQIGTFHLDKSEDGGENWDTLLNEASQPQTLFIHPANDNHIYIPFASTVSKDMYVSKDGGKTWDIQSLDRSVLSMVGDPQDADHFWTGGPDGLYETTDGGETYTKLQDIPISTMQMNPHDSESMVFGGRDFYYTNDGGHTIEEGEYSSLGIFIMDIAFNPANSEVIYAATGAYAENSLSKGGRGVLRSLDGGKSWESYNKGLENKDLLSLDISESGSYLYAGTSGSSVYRKKLFNLYEVEPTDDQNVTAGDEIDISFNSDYSGGSARFSIKLPDDQTEGNDNEVKVLSEQDYNMNEETSGLYQGTWQVPSDLEVEGAVIEVELTDQNGESIKEEAEGKVYVSLDDDPDRDDPDEEDKDNDDNDDDGSDDDKDKDDSDRDDENDQDEDGEDKDKDSEREENQEGEGLPKTATNMYTWILVGALLLMAGLAIVIARKVKANRKG